MTSRFLPDGGPRIDETDIAAVAASLKGVWLTGGPGVDAFESALAKTVGAPYAVVCVNGTAALHLAAIASDLEPGEAVIVPAITFAATANVVRFVGAPLWPDAATRRGGLLCALPQPSGFSRNDGAGRPRESMHSPRVQFDVYR